MKMLKQFNVGLILIRYENNVMRLSSLSNDSTNEGRYLNLL